MSFFSSLQQVVSEVTSSVSNLGLSPRRFSFARDSQGSQGSQSSQKSQGSQEDAGSVKGAGSIHSKHGGGRLGPKCVPPPGTSSGTPHPRGALGRGRKASCQPTILQQGVGSFKERERRPLPVLHCGDRFTFWPEYDPSQTWVSESDGQWLEQFTSLGWKHNESLKALRASTSRQASRDVPPEAFGIKIQGPGLSKPEMEDLYIEVLYTIFHQVGIAAEVDTNSPEDLVKYAQAAFHMDTQEHYRLQAIVQEEKPPIVVLNLVIVEAEGLEAKDPNGFSDPYCMLGIQPAVNLAPCSPRDFPNPVSPPPESPRGRGQSSSRGSQDTESESDGDRSGACESPRPYSKDNLRKHHSFRLSFKRRTGDSRCRDQRDSLSNAIPARIIRATSVRPHTLNPKWNEKFRLDIDDLNTDILHLDIWDHDDETSVFDMVTKLNEVKGVKGLGRFFKQIAQSARSGGEDDFLGCVNMQLQELPSTGLDKWFALEGRSQRSNIQGQIHLKMWLSTREDRGQGEETLWTEVMQHHQIISVLILQELTTKWKDETINWDGNLPAAAETILHQHALQGDLTLLQQAICRWQAYSETHVNGYPLDHRCLHRKLVTLHEYWDSDAITKEEEEMLSESFHLFMEKSLEDIRRHREIFPVPSKMHVFRLEGLFRCLSLLAESRAYWKCCPFHKEVRGEVLVALRKSAHDRYAALKEVRPKGMKPTAILEAFVRVVLQLTLDLQAGLDYYEHVNTSTLKIPYVSLNYKIFEKLIAEDTVNALEAIQTNGDTENEAWRLCGLIRELELHKEIPKSQMDVSAAPFLLYLALAEFSRFQEQVSIPERRSLVLGAVWPHFYSSVSKYLDIASWKLLCRIRTAILSDRVANTGEPVQYTTSAVDTTSCLYHVKTFWRHLAWPEPSSGYSLIVKLLQALSLCTDFYVGLLQQRLLTLPAEASDEDRAKQLCITVNNMEHVRYSFSLIYEELQLEEFCRILEMHEPRNGRSYADNLTGLLHNALVALHDRITDSMAPVAEKMRIELQRDVFHLAWSPESLPAEDAVRPLLDHLYASLTQFSMALLKNNLDRLLALLWHYVLTALAEQIGRDTEEKQGIFYHRLYEALELLREFFYAGGRGLDAAILQGYDYMAMENQLRLHKTATEQLIEAYHLERLNEQELMETQDFGTLYVRLYFNHDSLCVEVLQAKNVIPLDPNGLSDPFVVVELLPRRLFSESTPQHTNVHKKTLNPLFDECFEFPATLDSCRAEGAMVLFTLMDHDVITCNDFGGEAFLSLNSIPGVASAPTLQNFHGLKPIELPLMFRKDADNAILKVLETRMSDKQAAEFVKKQKHRLKP